MAIDPKTPSTLYAVVWTSGNPGLFKSTDSGGSWTNILANGTNLIETVAVDPKTPSTIYVGQFVGNGANALISTDGGAHFTPIETGLPNPNTVEVFAINPVTPATLYAGTINGVYKTTNSGGAWTETINGLALTNVTAVAVDPATPTTIYAGTSVSGLFKSTDSGGSWTSINTGIGSTGNDCIFPNFTALAIDPVTTTTLYASTSCTQSSGVFKSIDSGAHWTVAATGLPEFGTIYGLAIDPLTTSTVYAAAGSSGLYPEYQRLAGTGVRTAMVCLGGAFGVSVGVDQCSIRRASYVRAPLLRRSKSPANPACASAPPMRPTTPVVVSSDGTRSKYQIGDAVQTRAQHDSRLPRIEKCGFLFVGTRSRQR